jgi:hypothetical protein
VSVCIVTLEKMQKIVVLQNVPGLDLSNFIRKAVILIDRFKAQRVYIIRPIKSDVTE